MKVKQADVRIFISYAHRDPKLFRDNFESAVRWWKGVEVQLWTDENVTPGSLPDREIRAALDEMHIFVALISPLFDASQYIHEVEVPIARRRHKNGEVLVAPVVVDNPGGKNCDWLLGLERLPHKSKTWAEIRRECRASDGEYDDALKLLRSGIGKLVEQVRSRRGAVRGRRGR